jgi:hypothetical protein
VKFLQEYAEIHEIPEARENGRQMLLSELGTPIGELKKQIIETWGRL